LKRARCWRQQDVPRTLLGLIPKTSTGKIQKFVLRERAKENV
jgi:hypothetical protein